jgi:predicted alpha/beta hydrolase
MPSTPVTFEALDGRPLGGTLHTPAGPVAASLVVNGALAVGHPYYKRFGAWMAERGVAVLTYDYRGVGASRSVPLRRDPAVLLDWARLDASAAIDQLLERFPGVPHWGLGHSFGGQSFGLTPRARDLDGLVIVGAGSGDLALYPEKDGASFRFRLGTLVPVIGAVFGYVPGRFGLGEDLPVGVPRQWAKWCMTPDYMRGALGLDVAEHHRIEAPLHYYDFPDDTYAPPAAAAALRSWYTRATVTHRHVRPADIGAESIGHFGFFRPGKTEVLWEEVRGVVTGDAASGARASTA